MCFSKSQQFHTCMCTRFHQTSLQLRQQHTCKCRCPNRADEAVKVVELVGGRFIHLVLAAQSMVRVRTFETVKEKLFSLVKQELCSKSCYRLPSLLMHCPNQIIQQRTGTELENRGYSIAWVATQQTPSSNTQQYTHGIQGHPIILLGSIIE